MDEKPENLEELPVSENRESSEIEKLKESQQQEVEKFKKEYNFTIKKKVLIVVLLLNLLGTIVYTFFNYNEIKSVIEPSIEERARSVAYGAYNILGPFHDRIKDKDSISEDDYFDLVQQLSVYSKNTEVAYVYSFTKWQQKVVYSSTSATEEEIKDDEFNKFFDDYEEFASPELKKLLKSSSMDILYESTEDDFGSFLSVLIPFENRDGVKFVVGVDIEDSYIDEIMKDAIIKVAVVGFAIFVVSVGVFIIILNSILEPVTIIKYGIERFFKFLNQEVDSVGKLSVNSSDELGEVADILNRNLSFAENNISKDNALIHNIQDVSKHIAQGSFKHRIDCDANSPSLNEAKNVINHMLNNLEEVITGVINILREYSNHDYEVVIDKKMYTDELLDLVDSINALGKNISEEKLQNAYDALSIQKSANYLSEFLEGSINSYDELIIETINFSTQIQSSERFNKKIKTKLDNLQKDRASILENMTIIKKKIGGESREIKDIEHIFLSLEDTLTSINKEIIKELVVLQDFQKPILSLNDSIKENKKIAENSVRVVEQLGTISTRIRESINKCEFTGKDNINIMLQYVDK